MLEVLKILLGSGFITYGLCHISTVLGKCYIASVSKNLDKNKVESLAKMMSEDIISNMPINMPNNSNI